MSAYGRRSPTVSRTVVNRPDPNSAIAWALCVWTIVQIAIMPWVFLASGLLSSLLLGVLAAAISFALSLLDSRRLNDARGGRRMNPAWALGTSFLYLLVRMLFTSDPRAGRPFWVTIAFMPLIFFFTVVAVAGRYAAYSHGY